MMRFAAAVLAVMLAVAGFADAGEFRTQRVAMPVIKIENGGACVAPTAEMRRDHMKMLLHQRDGTMRQGLRDARFSLKNCVDCHASRETGSVLGKDGFCSSCHSLRLGEHRLLRVPFAPAAKPRRRRFPMSPDRRQFLGWGAAAAAGAALAARLPARSSSRRRARRRRPRRRCSAGGC